MKMPFAADDNQMMLPSLPVGMLDKWQNIVLEGGSSM